MIIIFMIFMIIWYDKIWLYDMIWYNNLIWYNIIIIFMILIYSYDNYNTYLWSQYLIYLYNYDIYDCTAQYDMIIMFMIIIFHNCSTAFFTCYCSHYECSLSLGAAATERRRRREERPRIMRTAMAVREPLLQEHVREFVFCE